MSYDPQSQSFSPRVSSSKGRWEHRPSLVERIPTSALLIAAALLFLYTAGLYLFGDGQGW